MAAPDRLSIAFVADTIASPLGGGVAAAHRVVEALRRAHDVTVVAADAEGAGDLRLRALQLPLGAMREMRFAMARPDRAALRRLFERVDVVHVQFPFWLGMVAVDEARRAGRRVIAAFHVQPENALLNVGVRSPALSRAVYGLWVRRFFERSDAVVCPTRFAERLLRAHGVTRPVHVLTNGVPPDLCPAAGRAPDHAGTFLVVSVGRLAAEKRQELVIEAARRARHRDRLRLVLAGAGPRERTLRRLARRLPHPAEIGFLPRERLARVLCAADLFVHASEVELEGIAVVEAMSVGLPVLVAQSPDSAASELALADDFRFPAGDARALADRIDALVDRPERLAEARARYKDRSRAFGFDESLEGLVRVYRGAPAIEAPRTAPVPGLTASTGP